MKKFPEMRRGLLEFVVLKRIDAESIYADELLTYLADTEFACPAGTLYPLLRKLIRHGYIVQSYEESDPGTPRKYYYLTDEGALHLKNLLSYWKKLNRDLERMNNIQIVRDRS